VIPKKDLFYDSMSCVQYRQHGKNMVGSNQDLKAQLKRLKLLWDGSYQKILSSHLMGLENLKDSFPQKGMLEEFLKAYRGGALGKP
jgi:hypothetical protein